MASLIELTNELNAALTAKALARGDWHKRDQEFEQTIVGLKERIAGTAAGLDYSLIDLALTGFYFNGDPRKFDEAGGAIFDAKRAIASSDDPLASEYIGLKNYDRWRGQREDHRYGYGPRHGSIVFSIGRRNPKEPVTAEQREAALYYLNNWSAILDASKAAREIA